MRTKKILGLPALALATMSLLLLSALATPADAQEKPEKENDKEEKKGLPLEPTRTLRFTAESGTWISLDVSPDGSQIVFDHLGDLYLLPIAGGAAARLTEGLSFDAQPRFSPDGSELIYRWGSQWFVSDVTREPEFRCGPPRLLFEGPYINVAGYSWDISADGRRFLVIEGPEQNEALTELVVLTDFLDRLP